MKTHDFFLIRFNEFVEQIRKWQSQKKQRACENRTQHWYAGYEKVPKRAEEDRERNVSKGLGC
jgi:DNA-directed RNA polymerase